MTTGGNLKLIFGEGIKLTVETSEYQESASLSEKINMQHKLFMRRYEVLSSSDELK